MKACRISNWWRYEVLKNGNPAAEKTRMASLRIKPLIYVRFPVHGHTLSSDYRRMIKRAGPELAAACDGLYKMLVGLAGNQVREYRGWVMDDRQQPLEPGQIAELLCLSKEKVAQILEILTDYNVKWVDFLALPEALHKSLNSSELCQNSRIIYSGNNQEKKGAHLIETVTEAVTKDKGFETEAVPKPKERVWEKKGGEAPGEKENVQPQAAPPPASVSVSGSVPVSDSDSERTSASVSVPASVPDSVSQPGAGLPGAESPGPLTKQMMFEIMRQRCQAVLEAVSILKINPRNKSDSTTISDIYSQLAQRLVGGSPYTLFESSLATARQCWRGDKPIAMFVAAMKKPPFYYVPKKLSVIPGKFSRAIVKSNLRKENPK